MASRSLDSNQVLLGGMMPPASAMPAESLGQTASGDPLGRPATAEMLIRGPRFFISLREDLDETELSVSLYHEVLEAATVAAERPPASVVEFNEGDFERAAQAAHARMGPASPERLNQMRAEFGFHD